MKETKNQILNHNSALTTFKLKKGKYYKVGVEKSIFALLLRAQKDIRKKFREIYQDLLNNFDIPKNSIDSIIEQTFSNKDIELDINSLNQKKLSLIANNIIHYREEQLLKQTSDEQELLKLNKEINEMALTKVANSKKQLLLTYDQSKEIIEEIKSYCKALSIDSYIDAKTIDFTILANKIGTNGTLLKNEIKKAVGTVLEFNYINKKNLDIEITSSLISSVRFTHDKKNNMTWMTYQIPREILELLLMPKMYVPLDGLVVTEIGGPYTYRMYSLFKDHLKRGWIEVTKEELFNFFNLPKSYQNKTNLRKKFLEPTINETEKVSGIKSEYTFMPKNSWKTIRFDFRVIKKIETEEINIVNRNEKITIWENKKILSMIEKSKQNIYVNRYWNKRVDNKINKLYMEDGEQYTLFILKELYSSLNSEIKTTLVQYINGIIKKKPKKEEIIKKAMEEPSETQEIKVIEKSKQKKKLSNMDRILYDMYLKMVEEERKEIDTKAEKIYMTGVGIDKISGIHEKIFEKSKQNYILEAIKGEQE